MAFEPQAETQGTMAPPLGEKVPKKRVHKFETREVSLVDAAANLKSFHVMKRRNSPMDPKKMLAKLYAEKALAAGEALDMAGYADLHPHFEPPEMARLLALAAALQPAAKSVENCLRARKQHAGGKVPVRKNAGAFPSGAEMTEVLSLLQAVASKAAEVIAKYPDFTVPSYPNQMPVTAFPKEKATRMPDLMTIPGAGTEQGLGDAPANENGGGTTAKPVENPGPGGPGYPMEKFHEDILTGTKDAWTAFWAAEGEESPYGKLEEMIQRILGGGAKQVPETVAAAVAKALEPISKSADARVTAAETARVTAETAQKEAHERAERLQRQLDLARPPPADGEKVTETAPTAKARPDWGGVLGPNLAPRK